jgi:hypothetical protein
MRLKRAAKIGLWTILALLAVWAALAYLLLPALWTHYEQQPALAGRPMITHTGNGIPGDPLNVGVVADERELVEAIRAAGWYPADPITLKTSLAIVGSVIFDRPYARAPVSNLYYQGRKQDLAFEMPAGNSANRRHHVRFWKVLEKGAEGRPVWLGSATFDTGSGLSHYTGQVTHHIAPDVDAERDFLGASLEKVRMLDRIYAVSGVGPTVNGRNGGGDRYFTDGEIGIGVITVGALPARDPPDLAPNPLPVDLKNRLFDAIGDWLD